MHSLRRTIRYVELKSGHGESGPAWIGWVELSKTGRTSYYRGRALKRSRGISGKHVDEETGEEYWISGVKRNGQDRHWAGSGPVVLDPDAADEYERIISRLDVRIIATHVSPRSRPITRDT